ncbi:MAG: hypothetical protein KatS3mg031_3114 [Chitinophagales bacterium]|jgi:hypothetical protein|nr:MAG: hypothetical protein KatS3mg031_3114 [Chitinophagales bacterium]
MKIYLFHSNLPFVQKALQEHPHAKAFWVDTDEVLDTLSNYYDSSTEWIVEESLFSRAVEVLPKSNCTLGFETIPTPSTSVQSSIAAYPSSDTIVQLLLPVYRHLPQMRFFYHPWKDEGAVSALRNNGIEAEKLSKAILDASDCLLFAVDWGHVEKYINYIFQSFGKPTFCMQESIIDFNTPMRRMERATYPLVQGVKTTTLLPRRLFFITGNPRYEHLTAIPRPSEDYVMINSNFTYGIHEDVRDWWLDDITSSLEELKIPYFISQHPREPRPINNPHVIGSNAAKVHQQLQSSSLLISRFSSLIHEAIAMGRPAIYYNPHGETLNYDFEPDGHFLRMVRTKEELKRAIEEMQVKNSWQEIDPVYYREYRTRHMGGAKSSERVAKVISSFAKMPAKHKVNAIEGYYGLLRQFASYMKKKVKN